MSPLTGYELNLNTQTTMPFKLLVNIYLFDNT